jgi:hypothetical protein
MHDTTCDSVLCPTYKNKHPCKYKYRQSEIVHFVLLLVHISLDTSPSISYEKSGHFHLCGNVEFFF